MRRDEPRIATKPPQYVRRRSIPRQKIARRLTAVSDRGYVPAIQANGGAEGGSGL